MKLSPLSSMRCEFTSSRKGLGWPARQLIAELRSRGEYVKSAVSTVEAPVVRAIRRDFAAISDAPDPDASLASEVCTDIPLNLMLVEVRQDIRCSTCAS